MDSAQNSRRRLFGAKKSFSEPEYQFLEPIFQFWDPNIKKCRQNRHEGNPNRCSACHGAATRIDAVGTIGVSPATMRTHMPPLTPLPLRYTPPPKIISRLKLALESGHNGHRAGQPWTCKHAGEGSETAGPTYTWVPPWARRMRTRRHSLQSNTQDSLCKLVMHRAH